MCEYLCIHQMNEIIDDERLYDHVHLNINLIRSREGEMSFLCKLSRLFLFK